MINLVTRAKSGAASEVKNRPIARARFRLSHCSSRYFDFSSTRPAFGQCSRLGTKLLHVSL